MGSWDYSQDERDWARDEADCPACEVTAGDPCIGVSRGSKDKVFEHERYVHEPRLKELFG